LPGNFAYHQKTEDKRKLGVSRLLAKTRQGDSCDHAGWHVYVLNVYCTQPLLPMLREVFHASELQVQSTVSATIFATALTAPFIGMIAERRGRKKVIVPSLFCLRFQPPWQRLPPSLKALIFGGLPKVFFVPGVIAVMLAYVNEEWAGRRVAAPCPPM